MFAPPRFLVNAIALHEPGLTHLSQPQEFPVKSSMSKSESSKIAGDDAPPMRARIQVTPTIALHPDEIQERFVRASGPGGQNVNKVSTAVELRFDVKNSPSLPDYVRRKLATLAGRRLTQDGVLILQAQKHRTQERNREDALARLIELIQQAAERDPPRIKTKPSYAARQKRVDAKKSRGAIKAGRGKVRGED